MAESKHTPNDEQSFNLEALEGITPASFLQPDQQYRSISALPISSDDYFNSSLFQQEAVYRSFNISLGQFFFELW